MKSTPATTRRRQQVDMMVRARRNANYIRILEFLVAAITLFAGIHLELFPFDYLLVLALLLGYPLIAQIIAAYMERKDHKQQETSRLLVQLDSLVMGFAMASLHFSLVPCLALLIIVHANAAASGGIYLWIITLAGTLIGAALGSFAMGFHVISPDSVPLSLTVISLVGLGCYVAASAVQTHSQTLVLVQAQQHLAAQQRQAVELSRKLAKYLSPQIWGSIFSGKRDAKLETRRKKLTVFFSDIKGFSAMSEELPLNVLTRMLNTYLSEMTRIAAHHGGTVDKFIGDAVMVFFGDPNSRGSKEDALACVAMAIDMQKQMKLLRQKWKREGIDQKLEIRIGINTGYCTVGNFGTDTRLDYTILGTDVNLASRLESACTPGHILISKSTYDLVNDKVMCRAKGEISVKGFNRPIEVFEVSDLKSRSGSDQGFLSVETEGFAIHMDIPKIRNFDKKPILRHLAGNAKKIKAGEAASASYETQGFSLFVDSEKIRNKERARIFEIMARCAKELQEKTIV